MSDLLLARRAAARDEHAWREIVTTATGLVHGAAWRFGLDDVSEDLLQDILERILRQIGTYRGESPLRAWIASVCYNQLRNAYRTRRLRERVFADLRPGEHTPVARESTDRRAIMASDHAVTSAAMAGLREMHWNVVVLRVMAELSTEQTARRLGVCEGTVKSRLNRALAELRLFVRVLQGRSVPSAARETGMTTVGAAARVRGALPLWRQRLPALLVAKVERQLSELPVCCACGRAKSKGNAALGTSLSSRVSACVARETM
jgi:RNA polymerase sigma-70 factor, ECF subfamily